MQQTKCPHVADEMSPLNLTKGHNKYIFLNIRNGKSMLNDENIISKSRSIIDLRNVNLTIQEFRLMEVYLSKINPQDETTASVTFTKQEYCDLMEIQSRLLESKRLNKYMQHLFNNSVTEWLEDGESFEMHPLFEKAKFDKKNSTITLECGKSDYVRKMFFDISKNGYIKYALKNTLYLQSVYSIKLYLYLLENRFRSTWKIELDCLKGIFECTSDYYNDFRRFNSKILKTSIDEINEMTNVFVSYETIRKARKVAEIEFTCHFKDTNEVINGEFEEKEELPSYNHDGDLTFEYVINEIQMEFGRDLNKGELKFAYEFYELYGGRMMIVALNESAVYDSRSLHYMKQLLETWTLKGYTVEQVENGKR